MKKEIKVWTILSLTLIIIAVSCGPPPGDEQLSPPIVKSPLYECATVVVVEGFVPGAKIEIYSDFDPQNPIGGGTSHSPWGQVFSVNPELDEGHNISAKQTYGGVTSMSSEPVLVEDYLKLHTEGLPRPHQKTPLYNCGGALGVHNLVPGGHLEVYADGNLVGSVNGCGAKQAVGINPNFTTNQTSVTKIEQSYLFLSIV